MADHNSDDLDQLLDAGALDDFSTLDLSSNRRDGDGSGGAPSSSMKGLGVGLPDGELPGSKGSRERRWRRRRNRTRPQHWRS